MRNAAAALDELAEILPAAQSTEHAVEQREMLHAVSRFLDTLPDIQRDLFVRRYWLADPVEELAVTFHKSRHYISVRLSRIRKALKQYLIKEGEYPRE